MHHSTHKTEEANRIQNMWFGLCAFTGKELDAETGYSYFGARYYAPTSLTAWLSVDPMSDKYPSISPYAYCAWNPVRLVDPDGNEAGIPPTWVRTGWFALRHPQIASAIGSCRPGEMNTILAQDLNVSRQEGHLILVKVLYLEVTDVQRTLIHVVK